MLPLQDRSLRQIDRQEDSVYRPGLSCHPDPGGGGLGRGGFFNQSSGEGQQVTNNPFQSTIFKTTAYQGPMRKVSQQVWASSAFSFLVQNLLLQCRSTKAGLYLS
jgi:hypothetical protein